MSNLGNFDDFDLDSLIDTDTGKVDGTEGFGDTGFEDADFEGSDFGDFGSKAQRADEISEGKQSVLKQAMIIALIGAVIFLLGFAIVKWLTTPSVESNKNKENTITSSQSSSVPAETTDNSVSTSNTWVEFGVANIEFEETYKQALFTVTDIKHFVKRVSDNRVTVSTTLYGTLSGFTGTYEIEIPYSKGRLLSVENSFSVEVQVGVSGKNSVIGEIKY